MPGDTHQALVQQGSAWLRRNGFGVVATELDAAGCQERPDVIGFRSACSAVIEVKASRGDFKADAKKSARLDPAGLGLYRFYLCPEGLIRPDELPSGWGLLYAGGSGVQAAVKPPGNLWPAAGAGGVFSGWLPFQHPVNHEAERRALYSIARRLYASVRAPGALS